MTKATKNIRVLTPEDDLTLDERDFGRVVGWPLYQGELRLESGGIYRTPHFAVEEHAESATNILVARYQLEVMPKPEDIPAPNPTALQAICELYRAMPLSDWIVTSDNENDDVGGELANATEIYYVRDNNSELVGCQILVLTKGPEVWVDTHLCTITGYWGQERVLMEMNAKVAQGINQDAADLVG